MKKNVLKIALFAFGLCSATALTSCHNGEDVDIVEVAHQEARTLVVHTNAAATVKVNGETKTTKAVVGGTGFEAPFDNPAKTGTIVVTPTASNRQTKTLNYDFKEDGSYLYCDVMLEAAGVGVPQATAEAAPAGTVNNSTGSDNATETGVDASIDFNGATNTNASATGDYSITVFEPSNSTTDAEDMTQGQLYEGAPLAIACTPDGATFSSPIKVTLNILGSEGYDINVVSGDETANITRDGNKVIADIPHFSIWEIILKATLESVETQVNKIAEADVNAKSGSYKYTMRFGYDCDQADNSLVGKMCKKLFGAKGRNVTRLLTWSPTEGTATVTVNQTVKKYTFKSSSKTFVVTAYGKITSSVVVNPAEETPTHGGGSN
jgi:hypothetical protein